MSLPQIALAVYLGFLGIYLRPDQPKSSQNDLAPRGVFLAETIASFPVVSYTAFSPLPAKKA